MRKTIKKLLILWAFLPVFMGMNTVFAASGTPLIPNGSSGVANLSIEAYNCSSYVNTALNEAEEGQEDAAIDEGLLTCIGEIQSGDINSTLKLTSTSTIDKNKYIVVITKFDSDQENQIRGLNYSLNYNNEDLTALQLNGGWGYIEDTDYPYSVVRQKIGGKWYDIPSNKYDVTFANPTRAKLGGLKQITCLVSTMDEDDSFGLNQHQILAYHAFHVNSDATAGHSLSFNFGEQSTYSDGHYVNPAGVTAPLNQTPLSFKVAGAVTSNDASLRKIEVSFNGEKFVLDSTTPFLTGSTEYKTFLYYVGNLATDIDFNVIANDAGAMVTSASVSDSNTAKDVFESEDNTIQTGMNTFTFLVTAADGSSVETYTINVYKLSDDASVKTTNGITADGITLNKNAAGTVYTGTTTYDDTDTTIYVDPTHQNAFASVGAGSWTLSNSGATLNTKNVIVSAENARDEYSSIKANTPATKTYTINITRTSASDNANLSDLKTAYNGGTPATITGFSKTGYIYNLGEVPNSTNSITIAATLDESHATILSGTGDYSLTVGDNTFEVKTKAQDNTTQQTYTIKVHRRSDDRQLKSLSATSNPSGTLTPSFTKSFEGTYKYGYDPTVTKVTISAEVNDTGKAKVAVVDATSGQPSNYTSSLNSASLEVNVPATTNVSVIVTSEDGGIRVYPITLERQQSNDNYLSNLVVQYEKSGTQTAALSPAFAAATRSYTVTIPADIDTVKVKPTKASTYATVRKIGDTTGTDLTEANINNLDFGDNTIQIVVYSESGVDNPYTLKIVRSKYNIATLDTLSLGTGSFTTAFASGTENYTYNGTIPYSQSTITINGTKTNSYANVQVSVTDEKNNTQSQTITAGANNTFSGTINLPTGNNTVGILVTAHDGTKKTYTVTITRDKNNDSSVSNLRVDNQISAPTYDADTHTYTVTVPFNTVAVTPGQVAITPTDTNAQVSKGTTVTDLTTTTYKNFTFRVTAENSTYTDYTVKIIKKKNDAALLTRETVKVGTNNYFCDLDQDTMKCTISVPVTTETFTMTSTISENATVVPPNGTEQTMPSTESSKELTISVTSEDTDTTNVYKVTVERAKSSDNSITDLQVDGTTISGFTTTGNSFSDTEGGSTSSIELRTIVKDVGKAFVEKATVNGTEVTVSGEIASGNFTFTAPLNYGTNNVVITVQAENGQKQNYNVTVTRQQNVTATIDKVEYGKGTATPAELTDWNKDGNTYTLSTVDYNTTSITLVAYPDDATYGTAKVTKVVDENNVTKYTDMANETTDAGKYKVTIPLSTGTNTITLVGYAHNTSVTKVYTLTVVREKNSDNSVSDVKVKGIAVTDNGDDTYSVTVPNATDTIVASDVTYTLPAGARGSVSPASLSLSTTTDNVVNLTVTSEAGVATVYPIHITRTKSSNNDLTKVSLKVVSDDSAYNGKDYYCNFDNTTAVSCTIDVPTSTTAYTITSTLADSTASVSPANGTSDTMGATESTKIINLEVTAEDNSKKQYTVTVRRTKSSNTNLAYLKIDGVSVENFKPDKTLYYHTVDGDTEEIQIDVQVEDVGRAVIENAADLENPLPLLFGNTNNIEIMVKAEDGTKRPVNIQVTRSPRTDDTLKEIKINGHSLDSYDITPDPYTPGTVEYTINTPFTYETTSLNVTATVNDPDGNARITSGIGNTSISTGTNTITIHVTAQDTSHYKDYKIHVTRAKNSDTSISAINLAGNAATYNTEENIWEVTVPNSVTDATSTNLIVTPSPGATTNDKLATVTFADTGLSSTTATVIPITVTAEDGTIDNTVRLKVTRTKSAVATLHTLEVVGGAFSPSFVPDSATDTIYTVTVPETATTVTVNATTTDGNAKILSGTGDSLLNLSNLTIPVVVESEDGKVQLTYQLKIQRTKSSDNTLKLLTVKTEDGTTSYDVYNYDTNALVTEGNYGSVNHYKVTIPGNVDTVAINAIANDTKATVDPTNLGVKTIPVGDKNFTIKVTSESNAANTYTLTIVRQKKANNNLSTLKVDNVVVTGFDPEITTYYLDDVSNDIASLVINAETEDADARIVSGTGTRDLNTGLNNLEVVVKAQNGEEKTYTIKVTREQSTDNRLSRLSINGLPLTPNYVYVAPPAEETKEYNVTLRYNKETFGQSDINAAAHNSTATITYDEDITLDNGETKSFNIKVTAENGDENYYTIRVTRAKSDNPFLKAVSVTVGDGTKNASISPVFNKETYEYVVSIPYGETSFTISGTPDVDSTTIDGNNATYNVGDQDEVTLTTYAETYKADGTEAERNATKTYRFRIEQSQSNNAYLSNLYVNGYGFKAPHTTYSQAYTNYDIGDIESDVTGLIVNATPENTNSTITYRVNTGNESESNVVTLPGGTGAGTITITVTAPDGLTKMYYTIAFNKVSGTNAYLLNLTTDKGSMSPAFIKTTRDYLITVDNDVESVNLTMYTEKRSSNVSINGAEPVSATDMRPYTYTVSDLIVGDTSVTILSTAEDGFTALTYNVLIRRAQPASSGDATLSRLSVDEYPFISEGVYTETTFAKGTTEYTIGQLPYKLDKVKVNYTPTQGESTVSVLVNGRSVAKDDDGYIPIPVENNNNGIITVLVLAPNGTGSKAYNIHYRKKASNDAKLANMVVSEGSLDPTFNANTLGYEVELPEGVNSETITVTLSDPNATLIVAEQEKNSPYVHTLTGLGTGTHRASFKVKAEDGTELTYYIDIIVQGGDELITSVAYGHTIDTNYIKTVKAGTTGGDMKNQLDNDNSKLEIWKADGSAQVGDGDKVGTGMIVKLIINGTEKDRKTIVVKGDTDGNGKITLLDAVKTLNHYLKKITLEGAYLEAADVDGNNKISLLDAVKILNHYLGKSSIYTV